MRFTTGFFELVFYHPNISYIVIYYHMISTDIELSYRSLGFPVNDLLPFKGLPMGPSFRTKRSLWLGSRPLGCPNMEESMSQPRDAPFLNDTRPGELTKSYGKLPFNGKIHYKWPCSIAMLVHQRVACCSMTSISTLA